MRHDDGPGDGKPQARSASSPSRNTLFLFLSIFAAHMHIGVDPEEKVTVNAQIARAVFGSSGPGPTFFAMLQIATLLILVLAANTSFADFPRLASFHAGDHFLPRQLTRYGDRLVFSNGIIVLPIFSSLLVIMFNASVTRLIPLYAIGVFTSFTFSQLGMAKRHGTRREEGWRVGLAFNGLGGVVSGVMTVIIAVVKFTQGAYLVLIAIPLMLAGLEWNLGTPLEVLPSPYREIADPIHVWVRGILEERPKTFVTIVVPQFVVRKRWHRLMHNQTALSLKTAFLFEPSVVVSAVPYRL